MKKIQIVILLFSPLILLADTHYVDINSTNPVSPYTNWFTAATNIQDAIDIAIDGDIVLVTNGIYNSGTRVTPGYSCLNRVVITNDITVKSVNGPELTFIVGAKATEGGGLNTVRGVYMGTGLLSGFTITNGHTIASGDNNYDRHGGGVNMFGGNGVVSNCILTGNTTGTSGGGSCYGTLNNCTLFGNYAASGGACYYGTLNNCALTGNNSTVFGGGSTYSTLNNCILTGNIARFGGGCFYGTLNNCTLTGNIAETGGGSCYGILNNCIVYYNKAPVNDNWYNGTLRYCCTIPMPPGDGNIMTPPILLSVSHIHSSSPCASAGSTTYSSGTDIDGDAWGNPPSIGCDNPSGPFVGSLDVSILANYTNSISVGYELSMTANIEGQTSSNLWTFGDSSSYANAINVKHAWANTGTYEVVMTSYNDDNLGGIHATMKVSVVSAMMHYVDINNTNPVPPYTSWASAATNIQDAVNEACQVSGNTVLVSNGVYNTGTTVTPGYESLNRFVITNDITVKSVNGPKVTIIAGAKSVEGGNAVRGVYMNAGVLSGFTITNGQTITTAYFHYDWCGGGVNMYGGDGVLSNCTLTGNSAAYYGGGSYHGTLNNCTLSGNSSINGGGSANSTMNNCALFRNNSYGSGGGSYGGILNNCTLSGNTTIGSGGGSYDSELNNCIVYYNKASEDDNWNAGKISYSCTTPMPSGVGNITNVPMLLSVSHIHTSSPCTSVGSTTYSSGADIDGDSWKFPPSIGCDEPFSPFSGSLEVSILADYNNTVAVGYELFLSAHIMGQSTSNIWSFGDSSFLFNSVYVNHAWSSTGAYDVVLTAYNNDNPGGVSATVTVFVSQYTFFVNINNSNPVHPYTSWHTAATNIQDAVNEASLVPGSIVLVTNGIYSTGTTVTPDYESLNRIVITNNITVKSVNGPDVTIIAGAKNTESENAVRGVYISAGILSGFTITNGHTTGNSGDDNYDLNGGGVNMYRGSGILSNCILIGNDSANDGGGCYDGTLNSCILTGNTAVNYGGGCKGSILKNCSLTKNAATYAGGCYGGSLNNCNLADNWAGRHGGGSIVATLYNCTLTGNRAGRYGGGTYNGIMYNCTITENTADWSGGGTYLGGLNNCILFNNTPENYVLINDNNYLSYCCTTPSNGVGCVTNDPQFINADNGDFRLKPSSPCIDSGLNADWMIGAIDLSGNSRIMGDYVDIGAYEFGFTVNLKVILEGAYENE